MLEIVLFIVFIMLGVFIELLLFKYYAKRHMEGRPVFPRLTKFNLDLAHNLEALLGFINYRLENGRNTSR